jgi:hypothetical protein
MKCPFKVYNPIISEEIGMKYEPLLLSRTEIGGRGLGS